MNFRKTFARSRTKLARQARDRKEGKAEREKERERQKRREAVKRIALATPSKKRGRIIKSSPRTFHSGTIEIKEHLSCSGAERKQHTGNEQWRHRCIRL